MIERAQQLGQRIERLTRDLERIRGFARYLGWFGRSAFGPAGPLGRGRSALA